jgi:hypothetical protein
MRGRALAVGIALGAILTPASALRAGAAVIVVETIVDGAGAPPCSLRDAIVAANQNVPWGGCAAGDGDDLIDLTGLAGTLKVYATLPAISGGGEATVIRGPGADRLSISGLDSHPVFFAEEFASTGVVIERLTIRDGAPICVLAHGFLTLRDARITSCDSTGGGAAIDMGLLGFQLTVDRSLVDDNIGGPAIQTGGTAGSGTLQLLSSTITNNDSGIWIRNNEGVNGSRIHSSTIADNRTLNLAVDHDQFLWIEHTILKRYPGRPRGAPPGVNCAFAGVQTLPPGTQLVFSAFNLDDDGTCGFNGPGDLEPVDPRLGPLADNGGPTPTRAPLADSPVLDAGDRACTGPAGDLVLDQRGRPRPLPSRKGLPARCDLGAVELSPNEVPEPAGGSAAAALLALEWLRRRAPAGPSASRSRRSRAR